jgi:DNA-directed RNA polymerase specialized sigma24 family protein
MDSELINRLLAVWFGNESAESERAAALEQILLNVQAFARKLARFQMGARSDEVEDIVQEVLVDLTVVLATRRASGEVMTARDFIPYVRTMVRHAAIPDDSAWARVAARLRYWLQSETFDRWDVDVCGRVEHRGRPATNISVEDSAINEAVSANAGSEKDFPAAVEALFDTAGGPIYFSVAIRILLKYFAVKLTKRVGEDEDSNIWDLVADKGVSPELLAQTVELLRLIWGCVARRVKPMSVDWKRSFLLNPGVNVSGAVFVWDGIVTREDFRKELQMEPSEFDSVFDRLPIEDAEIAELFGMSPAAVTSHRWRAIRNIRECLEISTLTRI